MSQNSLNQNHDTIDSTQGYHDSDISPARDRIIKRKKKLSLSIFNRARERQRYRRNSYPNIADDASSESSNMSFKIHKKSETSRAQNTNGTQNTTEYRSDSYQLLMPGKRHFQHLDKIDEANPLCGDIDINAKESHLQVIVDSELFNLHKVSSNSNLHTDGHSSNVSLPLSPELSVVENISINKELLSSMERPPPTLNETQANDVSEGALSNKYMISNVDVSMPLMGQDCGIERTMLSNCIENPNVPEVSNTFINNVKIDVPSMSDSLDTKLRNLLLESAKKMQVDTINNQNNATEVPIKRTRNKKRCSTPRKKSSTQKSVTHNIEPVVEEECMEFCSYGGRRSCPPAIDILPECSPVIETTKHEPTKAKGRKKKDVIKVKILRPKGKDSKKRGNSPKVATEEKSQDLNISVRTDSGINEPSGMFLQVSNDSDSVDLIHNHSETCLQTKDCLDDSVEFIEPSKTIISLNSDSDFLKDNYFETEMNVDQLLKSPELHCSNALDGIAMMDAASRTRTHSLTSEIMKPFDLNISGNSLITEDLSDEIPSQPSRWFLLSEEDTNMNASVGANLMQIFPLTCAVPNLSTITELSKENDSRKPTLETDDTRNDLDSQSLF